MTAAELKRVADATKAQFHYVLVTPRGDFIASFETAADLQAEAVQPQYLRNVVLLSVYGESFEYDIDGKLIHVGNHDPSENVWFGWGYGLAGYCACTVER